MVSRKILRVVPCVLALVSPAFGQGLWHPGASGTPMTDNVYSVDGTHRQVLWTTHAGFQMAVDGMAAYDNWRTVDNAPQIRIGFDETSVSLVWTPVSGAASFRVFAGAIDDPEKATDLSGWQSDNSFADSGLPPDTVRFYWIQASPYVGGGRNSAFSESEGGWYQTSAVFDCGFQSGSLSDWSSSQPRQGRTRNRLRGEG